MEKETCPKDPAEATKKTTEITLPISRIYFENSVSDITGLFVGKKP
jgi:hypothetical protein